MKWCSAAIFECGLVGGWGMEIEDGKPGDVHPFEITNFAIFKLPGDPDQLLGRSDTRSLHKKQVYFLPLECPYVL